MSKIFQDISKILPEMNITIDREKIVDNLNDSLTKFNSYFIQSLEKVINVIVPNQNKSSIIDNIKENIESEIEKIKNQVPNITSLLPYIKNANTTILNNFKKELNKTIYNLPSHLDEIFTKNQTLALFDKLVDYLNYSNPNNNIRKIVTTISNYYEIFTNNVTKYAELLSQNLNELKIKVIDLNITLINILFEGFENLTNLFTPRFAQVLDISQIKFLIQNKTSEIKSNFETQKQYLNGILNTTRITQLIEVIDTNNVNQLKDILKDSLNLIGNFLIDGASLSKSINNIIKNITASINNNAQLQNLITNITANNEKIISILKSIELLTLLSNDIKNIPEAINNYSSKLKYILNITLKALQDKISNANNSEVKKFLINFKEKYSAALSELKQAINTNNLSFDYIVPKIRKMLENDLISLNFTKFINIYQDFLPKLKEGYNNLTALFTLPPSLIKIKDTINNIKEQIKEKLKANNSTIISKNVLEKIVQLIKNIIGVIDITEISKIFTNIETRVNNSILYTKIEPYLKLIQSAFTNINETQIFETIQNLLNNRTELINTIKGKIGQINLTNSIIKLNSSLNKIKEEIISEMKNATKIKERVKGLKEKIEEGKTKIKNLINNTQIKEKFNSILEYVPLANQVYEKLINFNYSKYIPNFNYSKYLPILDSINIEDITNITRIEEIVTNITQNIKNNSQKIKNQLKEDFRKINESLYTCENSFISDFELDFSDLEKASANVRNKLKNATIGDLPSIAGEFVNQLIKNTSSKINFNFSIFQNEYIKALIEEANSTLIKLITKIESNEDIIKLLTRFSNVETFLKSLINNADSFSFLQILKNNIDVNIKTLSNIKLSSLNELMEKIKEKIDKESNELKKYEKLSQKISFLISEYFIENDLIQNAVDKVLNKTLVNEAINKIISYFEKKEDYYKDMSSENGAKIHDESNKAIKDIINNALNVTDNILKLNETINKDFYDLIEFFDLLKKKYESLISKNIKSESAKRRMEETSLFNLTLIDNTQLKYFLENMGGLLEKIGFNINSLEITPEIFDKVKEGLKAFHIQIIKIPNILLIGSNFTGIKNEIKEKIYNKFKELIKEQITQSLNSERMNSLISLETLAKLLSIFKNNKDCANLFIAQMAKFSQLIINLKVKIQNGDFNLSDLIQKIQDDYFSNNKKDIYKIIKGIFDSKTNSTLLSEFSVNLLNFTQQIFDYINNLPNILKIFGKNRLRLLSVNNTRRVDETGSLICKFDETFSEDLTASSEDITTLILKTGHHYKLNIQSVISLKANKDKTDTCANNNENIHEQITFNNISSLNIEGSKKRFKFNIRIKISRTWKRPSFFYLLMKSRMSLKSKRNLRYLDVEEDINSYCILDEDSDLDDAQLSCFGYNDNINENSANNNQITLSNFNSEYIELPKNLTLTKEPNEDRSNNNNLRYFIKSKSSGLSGGAIAGIIIALVVAVAIVVALIFYFRKKERTPYLNDVQVQDSMKNLKLNDKI